MLFGMDRYKTRHNPTRRERGYGNLTRMRWQERDVSVLAEDHQIPVDL